ncbi:MAG TPA: GTP 3',8-cyclase MoaA [Thermoplasmata archaeon]|nr:GTP 3',8-cyclase MoaA [Thermoplasmata archaeon]
MRDRYGREVSDLRISLTQRCNLRCVFCHMEGQPVAREELTVAEIARVVRAGTHVGIDRVKLTGGEPTLRTDLPEIIAAIRPHVREISMTTNALLLDGLAPTLRAAGLDRVNVSLPSLDASTYHRLTGVDGVDRVLRGIRAAGEAGLRPIKLNVVALHGATDTPEAVDALVRFAQDAGAWLQVIEFEPVQGRVDPRIYRALHSELGRLTEEAAAQAFEVTHNRLHDRPRYTFDSGGRPATVEVVQPVANPDFCMACHRLRLTSNGLLKGCLMTNEGLIDLRPALRAADGPAAQAELVDAFERAVLRRRPFYVGPQTPSPAPVPAGFEESSGPSGAHLPVIS